MASQPNKDMLTITGVLATKTEELGDGRFHCYITGLKRDDPLAIHGYGHTEDEARKHLSDAAPRFVMQKILG